MLPTASEQRRALTSVAVQFFVNGVIFASLVPRLPEIRERLGVELAELGWLISIAAGGGFLASLLADRVLRRVGSKATVVGGGLLAAGSLGTVGFATEPWWFAAALASLQFGDVLTDISMNMQGSQLSALRAVPVMNRLHGLWSIGTVVGGLLTVQLINIDVAVDRHLPVAALLIALTVLWFSRLLLDSHLSVSRPASDEPTRIVSRRSLIWFGAVGAAALTLEAVPAEWAAFRLFEDLGSSATLAGWGFVAFTSGMVFGRLSGDFAALRIGSRRLATAGAAVALLGLALAATASVTELVLVGFAVSGSGCAVVFPAVYDAAARAPGRPGRALGVMTAGMRVSALATPAVVGGLADLDGLSVGGAMLLVALGPAVMLILNPIARGAGERGSGSE